MKAIHSSISDVYLGEELAFSLFHIDFQPQKATLPIWLIETWD